MTRHHPAAPVLPAWRLTFLKWSIYILLFLIVTRLFYWQIIQGSALKAEAQDQYQRTQLITGLRGNIKTADGYLLVSNQPVYRVFVEPHLLEVPGETLAKQLTPLLLPELEQYRAASEAAARQEITTALEQDLTTKLSNSSAKWVGLMPKISEETRHQLEGLNVKGLGFEKYQVRSYPEASLAAHVAGFVGKNEAGEEVGYFGVEGALNQELRARTERKTLLKDALGLQLFESQARGAMSPSGREVVLTIRRDIQALAERYLEEGVNKYGAKSGEVIIMEPNTGKILAMAASPKYDPAAFYKYPQELYKNPSFTHVYEPGSTFKTLTVAAGIDTGAIKPDTQCPVCEGPRQIGKYTIKTWNNEYHPQITMTEALAKSDNTAMMYIADEVGAETLSEYFKRFGIGDKTYTEIQEDTVTPFPTKWGPVELATASFGQGISTTSIQLVRAVAAIANRGNLMKPLVVEKVVDPITQEVVVSQPKIERQVISSETADQVTKMMIEAAAHGEAQWIASKTHQVAGKTGTSQVAVNGQYDPEKTIATFIGFTPPENPRFIMLVKLVEPQSSPWAAETAAPLWYKIAERLYLLLNIPADK
ncbi:MAG TPA: penicillin-binding protein 2 [Vitreimonas sp.]|nr:penicillin-binding protein 2 [Vitreimonas sp.]